MRKYQVIIKSILFICMISFGIIQTADAAVRDGFQTARRMESRYFDIYIESGVDLQALTMKLSVPPSIKSIIRRPVAYLNSYTLVDQLDTLLLAVLEIMDIRLKNFKCKLKICKNRSGLSDVADTLFGQEISPGGFYVVSLETLYVDAENVTLTILGHELSHAVQTQYFVVPPPEKIQEVLAGYVEFQLRKYTDTLPR